MPGVVADRPWRLAMGLRPLDPAAWLEVDDRRPEELTAKHRLLADRPDRVLAVTPGAEPAARELLDAVVAHLTAHHPGLVERTAGGALVERSTGALVDPAALHPVDAAARLVQEDLCVMEQRDGRWVLTAASVCFPSRWSLAAKVGTDLAGIHAPVPGFAERLGSPTEATFDRLRPERPLWRRNWTLLDDPALHQPGPARSVEVTDPGRQVWFRVERQTLRRLGDRPAVTFTIRTTVTALADLVAADPSVGAALRTSLAGVPEATVAYKGWAGLLPPVRAWLEEVG